MAFYSDVHRLKLAKWVKYAIIISVLIVVIFAVLISITKGLQQGSDYISKNIFSMIIGLLVPLLVYEKLQKQEDDNWRKLAEILGTIQVAGAIIALFITIIIILSIFY